ALMRAANFAAFYYRVNAVGLAGATEQRLTQKGSRALGYSRLLGDAAVTRPELTIPATISAQMLPLKARGFLAMQGKPETDPDNAKAFLATPGNSQMVDDIEANQSKATPD